MTISMDVLVDHIDQPGIDADPGRDILRIAPDITLDQALAVQLAVKRRRVAEGDRIVGHQGSFTTTGVRKMFPDAPRPMVGTLLSSLVRNDGEAVVLDAEESLVESEIALILKRDLEGPDLTDLEVLAAIDCFMPSLEIAPLRPGARDRAYSYAHLIAVQKAAGGYVAFGPRQTVARGLDVALEACVVSVDGAPLASGVGFEAMGSPIRVVALMARALHGAGEKLLAGQVVMTGSLPSPPIVTRANRCVRAEFTRLGGVSLQVG